MNKVSISKINNYAKRRNYTIDGVTEMYVYGYGIVKVDNKSTNLLEVVTECFNNPNTTSITVKMTREDDVTLGVAFYKEELCK